MSNEEKAIKYFKRQIPKLENIIDWNETFYINTTQSKILKNSLITIINLIEKQQKEIEEKSTIIMAGAEKVKQQQKEIEELKKYKKDNIQVVYGGRRFGTEGMVVKDYISKDKIREKIKEIESYAFTSEKEKQQQDYAIERLNEILEE